MTSTTLIVKPFAQRNVSLRLPTELPYRSSENRKTVQTQGPSTGRPRVHCPQGPSKPQSMCGQDGYFTTRITILDDCFSTASWPLTIRTLSKTIQSKAMLLLSQEYLSQTQKRIHHYDHKLRSKSFTLLKGKRVVTAHLHSSVNTELTITRGEILVSMKTNVELIRYVGSAHATERSSTNISLNLARIIYMRKRDL